MQNKGTVGNEEWLADNDISKSTESRNTSASRASYWMIPQTGFEFCSHLYVPSHRAGVCDLVSRQKPTYNSEVGTVELRKKLVSRLNWMWHERKGSDKYYGGQEICLKVMCSCFVARKLELKSRLNSYDLYNSEQKSQAQFLFRLNENDSTSCLLEFLWGFNVVMHKSTWKYPSTLVCAHKRCLPGG